MLKSLEEVQAYTHRLSEGAPEIASEIALRMNAVTNDGIEQLSTELGLPPIYRACAAKLHLYGVSLGFFALWPTFDRSSDLRSALYTANSNNSEKNPCRDLELVIVAREEANPIGVGSMWSSQPDVVHYVHTMGYPSSFVEEIAPDFEKLIILAANLHKLSYDVESNMEESVSLVGHLCNLSGCTRMQSAFWERKVLELVD